MDYTPISNYSKSETPKSASNRYLILVLFILLCFSLALNVFLFLQQSESIEEPVELTPQQAVAQLIYVPENEPTIAEITNLEALQLQQPNFYKFAQIGDLLLVYEDRAVIFRESENKIVGVTLISE